MILELENAYSVVDYDWRTLEDLKIEEVLLKELIKRGLIECRSEEIGYTYRRMTKRWATS